MGYSIASLLQTTMLAYTFFLTANIASFGLECYFIGFSTTREINGILRIADKKLIIKKEHSLAMKRFTELIEWHSFVKQLSELKLASNSSDP